MSHDQPVAVAEAAPCSLAELIAQAPDLLNTLRALLAQAEQEAGE